MNINRVLEGTSSSDTNYGTGSDFSLLIKTFFNVDDNTFVFVLVVVGIGMEGVTKDGTDQKQRPPPGSSGGTNNGQGNNNANNNNNSSTTADVDSFINF
jgi:hypothetical protein